MKAHELNLDDVFVQTSDPGNVWTVKRLHTIRRGGKTCDGNLTQMGKTDVELLEGSFSENLESSGSPICICINPNVNVELIKEGNTMMVMRFGKHKGAQLRDVPSDYLIWCYENATNMLDRQQLKYIKQACINTQA
jgi:hypothetical protein